MASDDSFPSLCFVTQYCFECPLVFIHGAVGTFENIVVAVICRGIENCKSDGHSDRTVFQIVIYRFLEGVHKLLAVFIIAVFKENDKFVAAYPENRTVLKPVADDPAGTFDVFVAGFVS